MQTREQWKIAKEKAKDWKVVGTVAAVSALGLSSMALAGSENGPEAPDAITLQEPITITQVAPPPTVVTPVAEVVAVGGDDLDSPFDGVGQVGASSADSPAVPAAPAAPAASDSPASADSPAAPAASDSPASADSPASGDGSADT